MTETAQIASPSRTYFVDDVRFPFCRGCGHIQVLRRLNDAMVALQLPSEKVALVTDIGCIGLADGLFKEIHTVHTTHGRSTAFATGIALADRVLAKNDLHIIVLIGDGGAMIGLQHLVHAAMLNVNLTVLICNNFVYGMTGGQGSGLTPECFVTATTPAGNIVPPADLCGILVSSKAAFVARELATGPDLSKTLQQAIAFPGFAAVEVLELCTEFAVPQNDLNGRKLKEIADANGWLLGIIKNETSAVSFEKRLSRSELPPAPSARTLQSHARSPLGRDVSIVLGGSAGEKVQSAAAAICRASVQAGIYATQKNDNPVTQGSGFSLAEISLSPQPIRFTGIEVPDVIIAASEDGTRELTRRGSFASASNKTLVIADDSLIIPVHRGNDRKLPLRKTFGVDGAAVAAALLASNVFHVLPRETILSLAKSRLRDKADLLTPLLS